jgi:hypothetical protein
VADISERKVIDVQVGKDCHAILKNCSQWRKEKMVLNHWLNW